MRILNSFLLAAALALGLAPIARAQITAGPAQTPRFLTVYIGTGGTYGSVSGSSGALTLTPGGSNQSVNISGTGLKTSGYLALHIYGSNGGGLTFSDNTITSNHSGIYTSGSGNNMLFYTGVTHGADTSTGVGLMLAGTGKHLLLGGQTTDGALGSALQIPSSQTAGMALYNTSDVTTNYEALQTFWSSNVAIIQTKQAGSGASRALALKSLNSSGGGPTFTLDVNQLPFIAASGTSNGSSSTTKGYVDFGLTRDATSGTQIMVSVTPTYNQASGTAANTDFLINRTQTAVGSGAQNLIDAQVGGASKFRIDNNGSLFLDVSGTSTNFLRGGPAAINVDIGAVAGSAVPLRIYANQAVGLTIDTSQNSWFVGTHFGQHTSASGGVASTDKVVKAVTGIANNTATDVLTVTIPNAAHSGSLNIRLTGSLGAGGAIGANEATGTIEYNLSITRTAGVATVTTASTAYGSATSSVAGAATITITAAPTAMTGAVGATQTFTVQVTIARGSGSSTNHTCQVVAELNNANASGITIQ